MPRNASRAGTPLTPPGASRPGPPGRFGPGPGSAGGSPAGGPGYPPSGGPWSAPPGIPVPGGPVPRGTPAGPYGTFDGGYAQVIRATDYPAPPSSRVRPPNAGRPAGPERPVGLEGPVGPADPASPADADVFVYRDTGGPPDGPAAGSPVPDPAEHDAAYWYDLLAEDAAPRREETRGPFEPLVSSGAPAGPGAAPTGTAPTGTAPTGTAPTGTAPTGTAPTGTAQAGTGPLSPDDTAQAQARPLEQLRDLYLTAEAIGEQNVDKHFDQILARQRELISEYFRQSAAAGPGGPQPGGPQPGQSGPAVAGPRDGTAKGAGVAAEQPHTW
jgi:hypothetical protein